MIFCYYKIFRKKKLGIDLEEFKNDRQTLFEIYAMLTKKHQILSFILLLNQGFPTFYYLRIPKQIK